jgi:hypothetical protein
MQHAGKKKRNECRILLRKSEGKKTLGRPRLRLEDNIEADLSKIGWDVMD